MSMHIVRVVSGNDRRANFLSDLQQLRIRFCLCGQTMVLNLDKKIVLAKNFLESSSLDLGVLVIVFE